jgi:hypothetical protein
MNYNCPRCGYETMKKTHFKRHLQRKRICLVKLEDIDIDVIYKEYFNDVTKLYTIQTFNASTNIINNKCSFCNKIFYDVSTVRRHMKDSCKENPLKKYQESIPNPEQKTIGNISMENIVDSVIKKLQLSNTDIESISPINGEIFEEDSKFISNRKKIENNYENEIENATTDYYADKRNKLDDCIVKNCDKLGKYNDHDKMFGLFCVSHANSNMVNVIANKCIDNHCNIRANFNYKDETTGIYCDEHKKDSMVNVLSKQCIEEGCILVPSFNYKEETTPLYCADHKRKNMVNVKYKYCPNCTDWADPRKGSRKYNNYCARCYQHLFPTDALTLAMRSKTKEIAVRDFINTNFVKFQHDIPLYTGDCDCTHRRRIDHRRIIDNTILAIETDENQHKYYNKEDEEIRYNDLYMAHSGKWIFIRFNPDNYTNSKGQTKKTKMENRLKTLEMEIRHQMSRIVNEENNELVEIIYLFYDGFE